MHFTCSNNASYIPKKESTLLIYVTRMIPVVFLMTILLLFQKKTLTFSFDDSLRIKYFQSKYFYFQGHPLSVALRSYLKSHHSFNNTISELSVKDRKQKVRRKFCSNLLEFRSSDEYQPLHYKRMQKYFLLTMTTAGMVIWSYLETLNEGSLD